MRTLRMARGAALVQLSGRGGGARTGCATAREGVEIKLGVTLPFIDVAVGGDSAAIREFAQAAEEIGYQDLAAPDHVLVLQPGFKGSSSFPMALAGSLLMPAAPARPGARGLTIRRLGPDQMPEQAAHFGYGERQEIGFEIHHAFFPRPRRSGSRRDRHAPASPA